MPSLLDPIADPINPVTDDAARRRAQQDALLKERQQQTTDAAAAAQRAAADAQNKQLGNTMKTDALQWTGDPANPQYHIDWAHQPEEFKQHLISSYPSIASNAPQVVNEAAALNGFIPGLENHTSVKAAVMRPDGSTNIHYEAAPTLSPAISSIAATHGVKLPPGSTNEDAQALIADKQQQAESQKNAQVDARQQTQQSKADMTEWQKLVRQNPTAQTVAKNLSIAERNLQSIEDNSQGAITPAMQNNILTAFMGIEKPGVSPTNEDRNAALATRGWTSSLGMHLKNIATGSGDILTPGQIGQMKAAARLTINSYRKEYEKHVSSAVQEALARGLDPNTAIAPGIYDHTTGAINAPRDPNSVFGEGTAVPATGATATQAAPAPGTKPNVTREQYEALPSGAPYFWNGQQLKKK